MGKPDNSDKIRSLELALQEQRRDYDVVERLYDSAKVKNISFLAAALALLTYLYGSTDGSTLASKLFIPKEPYGVIIYAIGLVAFLLGIGVLLLALKPRIWMTAYDREQDEVLLHDYENYLRYMSKRYIKVSRVNGESCAKKQSLLNTSYIPLLSGGILLLMLKTFGG